MIVKSLICLKNGIARVSSEHHECIAIICKEGDSPPTPYSTES